MPEVNKYELGDCDIGFYHNLFSGMFFFLVDSLDEPEIGALNGILCFFYLFIDALFIFFRYKNVKILFFCVYSQFFCYFTTFSCRNEVSCFFFVFSRFFGFFHIFFCLFRVVDDFYVSFIYFFHTSHVFCITCWVDSTVKSQIID